MSQALEKLLSPANLNGLELPNRVIKAATFEGMTENGGPGDRLIGFHKAMADGGVGMTTLAYCAVEADGKVKDNMMHMDEVIRPQLERFTRAMHESGAKVSGQMAHCGGFSQNSKLQKKRPLGPSFALNLGGLPYGIPFVGAMQQADIDHVVRCFYDAAVLMKSVGFDALELHFGHGYGMSQFISPKTNKRTDQYGGSLVNRMRFPLMVLESVRKAVGDDFPLLGKMGLTDGVKGGLKIDEAIEVAAMLDQGGIDALIPSGGTSSMNPMLMFRGDSIVKGMLETETNPLMKLGLRIMSPIMFKKYPYEELYFLDGARRVRDRVDCKLVYIGGACTVESFETAMQEFDFVQLGRGLINDPDLVKNLRKEQAAYVNGCTHCNMCAGLIGHPDGIRCVLND
ncbi:MAG: NADH:flavin oxidoreductase [Gammaproteobacteria bacterium]|nr:NADH:flavin oxidoreductase [Gammaproteobacteria bacterium]